MPARASRWASTMPPGPPPTTAQSVSTITPPAATGPRYGPPRLCTSSGGAGVGHHLVRETSLSPPHPDRLGGSKKATTNQPTGSFPAEIKEDRHGVTPHRQGG